jgi:hypothetical protein
MIDRLPVSPSLVYCTFPDLSVIQVSILDKNKQDNQCLISWVTPKGVTVQMWICADWITV